MRAITPSEQLVMSGIMKQKESWLVSLSSMDVCAVRLCEGVIGGI